MAWVSVFIEQRAFTKANGSTTIETAAAWNATQMEIGTKANSKIISPTAKVFMRGSTENNTKANGNMG